MIDGAVGGGPANRWALRELLMDHKIQLKHLAVLYWLGGEDFEAVSSWAEREYSVASDRHPRLHEVFRECNNPEALLVDIAAQQLSFSPSSLDGERFALRILTHELRRFLSREITPSQICKLVCAIDNQYLGAHPMDDRKMVYYPTWLGNLYNACDWCDETWRHADCEHLIDEAKTVLFALESMESDEDQDWPPT
jgi:hypothetical protein